MEDFDNGFLYVKLNCGHRLWILHYDYSRQHGTPGQGRRAEVGHPKAGRTCVRSWDQNYSTKQEDENIFFRLFSLI